MRVVMVRMMVCATDGRLGFAPIFIPVCSVVSIVVW